MRPASFSPSYAPSLRPTPLALTSIVWLHARIRAFECATQALAFLNKTDDQHRAPATHAPPTPTSTPQQKPSKEKEPPADKQQLLRQNEVQAVGNSLQSKPAAKACGCAQTPLQKENAPKNQPPTTILPDGRVGFYDTASLAEEEAMKNKIRDLETRVADMETQLADRETQIETISAARDKHSRAETAAKSRIAALETAAQKLREEFSATNKTKEEATSAMRKDLEASRAQTATLERKLNALADSSEKAKEELSQKVEQLERQAKKSAADRASSETTHLQKIRDLEEAGKEDRRRAEMAAQEREALTKAATAAAERKAETVRANLSTDLKETKDALLAATAQRETAEEEAASLRKEFADKERQLSATLRATEDKLKLTESALESVRKHGESNDEDLTKKLIQEVEARRTETMAAEEKVEALKAEAKALERKATIKESEAQTLQADYRTLKDKLSQCRNESEELREAIDTNKHLYEQLKQKCENAELEANSWKEKCRSARSTVSAKIGELKDSQTALSEMKAERDRAYDQTQATIVRMSEKSAEAEARYAKLEEILVRAQSHIAAQQASVAELTDALSVKERALIAATGDAQLLESDLRIALKTHQTELSIGRTALEATTGKMHSELESLKRELAAITRLYDESVEREASAGREMALLHKTIADGHRMLTNLQHRNKNLVGMLQDGSGRRGGSILGLNYSAVGATEGRSRLTDMAEILRLCVTIPPADKLRILAGTAATHSDPSVVAAFSLVLERLQYYGDQAAVAEEVETLLSICGSAESHRILEENKERYSMENTPNQVLEDMTSRSPGGADTPLLLTCGDQPPREGSPNPTLPNRLITNGTSVSPTFAGNSAHDYVLSRTPSADYRQQAAGHLNL